MKNVFLKYILTLLFATYFIIGGVGYNIVNYCCQSCANEGIEEIAISSCFNVHHHSRSKDNNPLHKDLLCSDLNKHIDDCQFLRILTDIPSIHSKHQLNIEHLYVVYLFNSDNIFLAHKNEDIIQNNIPPPENLLTKTGRTILTFHAVLII